MSKTNLIIGYPPFSRKMLIDFMIQEIGAPIRNVSVFERRGKNKTKNLSSFNRQVSNTRRKTEVVILRKLFMTKVFAMEALADELRSLIWVEAQFNYRASWIRTAMFSHYRPIGFPVLNRKINDFVNNTIQTSGKMSFEFSISEIDPFVSVTHVS